MEANNLASYWVAVVSILGPEKGYLDCGFSGFSSVRPKMPG
jgi:hypothetical protein